jgi:very-short-patch-repair endonuclease
MSHRRTSSHVFVNSAQLRHNSTEAEEKLWQVLRMHQLENTHFRRQHAIGSFIVDFCAPHKKIVIEIDGKQHQDQQEYDNERTQVLESKGYQVLRFWNEDVINHMENVLDSILSVLRSNHDHTPSTR